MWTSRATLDGPLFTSDNRNDSSSHGVREGPLGGCELFGGKGCEGLREVERKEHGRRVRSLKALVGLFP